MRRALLILAFLGTALFGAAFAVSFLNPLLVNGALQAVGSALQAVPC